MTPEEFAKLQAENDRLQAENAHFKAEQLQAKKQENTAFLNDLIGQGKLAPVAKDKAENLLNYASEYDQDGTLNFSEGENLTQQVKGFLQALPQIVHFNEIATAERVYRNETNGEAIEYAEHTSPDKIEMDQKIRRYMAQHKLSYTAAFLALTQGEDE